MACKFEGGAADHPYAVVYLVYLAKASGAGEPKLQLRDARRQ